ncbi:MAG: DUF4832 domain-containing protein [Chlorobi bacterium]|nr:DUF4832 domain-containing protein [Chlorobiota bacterium]
MKNFYKYIFVLVTLQFSFAFAQNTVTVNYLETDEIFSNPERGFSSYRGSPISQWFVNSLKRQNITVAQRIYTIPEFRNAPLSDEFLDIVRADMNMARQGGIKLVVRFSYTDDQNGEDAPLDRILEHINQLQPIFEDNYDVINYIEAGFIGAWGEWYYSSNHLNNTEDRRAVLFALLDALPTDRCVVVRTPDYKRKIFDYAEPLSPDEAFNGTKRARAGAHNDCFLASATDYGTYLDNDIEGDKDYLNQDNRYVPQGGETCNPSEYSGCENALIDLNRMHWSVLNQDYNEEVLDGWETGGCMNDVKRRLGYRFVLQRGEFTEQAKPGGEMNISLRIVNRGFAAPFNPRSLEFVLRGSAKGKIYRLKTDVDPRFWSAGDTLTFTVAGGILSDMPEGNYSLFAHLADPTERLHDRPEYSIRFANQDVWEDSTGFNLLYPSIEISADAGGNDYDGDNYFTAENSGGGEIPSIIIDGYFDDWNEVTRLDLPPDNEESGDALNDDVDIVDIWAADDEENLFISYSLQGVFADQYFYHVFIDADNDTATGFHTNGSYGGFELMLENDLLWKYTGENNEWSWSSLGGVASLTGVDEPGRVEIALPKSLLSILGAADKIGMIFNVNNLDDNVEDDYAPNSYETKSFQYKYLVTSVEDSGGDETPEAYALRAFPNPFNGIVNITYSFPVSEIISGGIYDILGRKIYSYSRGDFIGDRIIWKGVDADGAEAVSGVYFFALKTAEKVFSKKLILLK